ncbi:MAG: 4-hydroxy-3-methylbut-2-enyl diphosphate reductase [Phycisphaerales bacterium]|jgi:4-hydroxy-3-methylbut-2-enyl diphosphate reductase|nr:4-hydroxy-3-methylbut-2-enyl diphosphate reductase [Phycisphaerales bacterium]
MNIILANPRGFCAGVNMAIECVEQVLALKGPPIYVYHEIVHNRHVVEGFVRRGVRFVNDISEVPEGGVIIYSAHGISPAVRESAKGRSLVEVDATCPLVTKVHMEVLRFARDGYKIIFIGHRNHDEAIGTVGEAPGSIIVVESPEDVAKLQIPDTQKVAYVTQTTLSISDAERIVAALKDRFPEIRGPGKEDICYATTNRQNAVTDLSPEVDVVLVIGSKNSSNSQRLVDRAREAGKPAYLIDDKSEMNLDWFEGKKSVLVTAGASAPEHLVKELLEMLKSRFGATIDTRTLVEEDISFEMPKSLKRLVVLN